MILSRTQLEEIAAAVTDDFNRFYFGISPEEERDDILPTLIDQLAKDYLGLQISFAHLSSDGNVCGLTAYANTRFTLEKDGVPYEIFLRENEVVLDDSFIQPGQVRKLCHKRRFTLAHECAHQILFQMETDDGKEQQRENYSPRRAYSLRDLKTKEDWNEWQANVLGAAILMPKDEMTLAMWQFNKERTIQNFDGLFHGCDRMVLTRLCECFGVSTQAVIIRLRDLGYIRDRPRSELFAPMEEVWA